jgi:hypothetical protein
VVARRPQDSVYLGHHSHTRRQGFAISLIDADASRGKHLTAFSDAVMNGFTWSPDGTRIVFD